MKIAIIIGTRPEIIKFSPIIRELERLKMDYFILHTGQHYSYLMDQVFFEDLGLKTPNYNLEVGSGSHGVQTGKMLMGIEKILAQTKPDIVLVEGDTNTVLAGGLAAVKMNIKVGHVEAGLRSYDRRMPEEINRVVVDHCSDLLFSPTEKSKLILLGEGISSSKIFVTGNTIVDAVHQNLAISEKKAGILESLGIKNQSYFLVTIHRQENVDNSKRLSKIMEGLAIIHEEFNLPVVFPIHPRTKKQIDFLKIMHEEVMLVEPFDYLNFLQLESHALLVLTDSGGVQEETCVLHIPCVTIRDNTERPETLEVGSNMLAGTNTQKILDATKQMVRCDRDWPNPFGDGYAGKRIVNILNNYRVH